MVAALLPAMFFYGAILCQLDFTARRMGLPAYVEGVAKPLSQLRLESVLLAVAFVVMLGGIFWFNLQPELAAWRARRCWRWSRWCFCGAAASRSATCSTRFRKPASHPPTCCSSARSPA